MAGGVQALTGRLNPDELDPGVIDELGEHADRVGAAAHAGDDRVRQPPRQAQDLGAGLPGDDPVVLAHDRGEGVRPGRRAQQVVGVGEGGRPVAQRLVDGVLERARTTVHRDHRGAHELHALDIGRLTHDVGGPHVDGAVQAQQGADHGGGRPVLAGAGLGDDAPLTHPLGQEGLPQNLVALVGATMDQVLALEQDAGIALQRQVAQLGDRRGTPQVAGHERLQLGGEGRIGLGVDEGVLELVQRRDEQLGHELAPVGSEEGRQARVVPRLLAVPVQGRRRALTLRQRYRGGQLTSGLGRLRGPGQGRAHQEGVHQARQAPHVLGSTDPRLTHKHHPGRGQGSHLLGARQIRLQGAQITVVDADDLRPQGRGTMHLLRRGDLREHLHAQAVSQLGQLAVDVVGHHREHEQDRVRPQAASRQHLDLIDDEVLAQDGDVHHLAHSGQVVEGAVETIGLGEHRDRGRVGRVLGGQRGRVVVGADGAA